jgi:hypothetical protein
MPASSDALEARLGAMAAENPEVGRIRKSILLLQLAWIGVVVLLYLV